VESGSGRMSEMGKIAIHAKSACAEPWQLSKQPLAANIRETHLLAVVALDDVDEASEAHEGVLATCEYIMTLGEVGGGVIWKGEEVVEQLLSTGDAVPVWKFVVYKPLLHVVRSCSKYFDVRKSLLTL